MTVTIQFESLQDLRAFLSGEQVPTKIKSKMGRPRKTELLSEGIKKNQSMPADLPKARKKRKSMAPRTGTLTEKIRNQIETFMKSNTKFTANDVYDAMVKSGHKDLNKQSVITSVLKLMKSAYKYIKVKEIPGNGPRLVKLYVGRVR